MTDPLLVDISPWSPQRPGDWAKLSAAGPPWAGVILKGGEGLVTTEVFRGAPWLLPHAAAVTATGLDLGLYWYLRLDAPGEAQADAFADLLARVPTTLRAIVDVEEGSGNAAIVKDLGAELVEKTVSQFASRIADRTGIAPILYAGGWLRGLGLRSRMGCEVLWLAAYVASLPAAEWCDQLGFTGNEMWAWQYAGSDRAGVHAELAGYPRTTPVGPADISAVVHAGGVAAMRWIERPRTP